MFELIEPEQVAFRTSFKYREETKGKDIQKFIYQRNEDCENNHGHELTQEGID